MDVNDPLRFGQEDDDVQEDVPLGDDPQWESSRRGVQQAAPPPLPPGGDASSSIDPLSMMALRLCA